MADSSAGSARQGHAGQAIDSFEPLVRFRRTGPLLPGSPRRATRFSGKAQHGLVYARQPVIVAVSLFLLVGLLFTGIVCHGCHSHEEEIRLGRWLSAAYAGEPARRFGQIAGLVRFTGQVPPPRRVETNEGSILEIVDLEVHPQNRGVHEVFVYLENPPALQADLPKEAVVIDQVNLRFRPRVAGVLAGQEVRFENNDTCNHGVQTVTSLPANHINATAGPGTPIVHRFQAQRGPIIVGCPLHPWMRAYLFALPHRFFAVTNERGEFQLAGITPATYRLRFVHPLTGWQTDREVIVRPNETTMLLVVWERLPGSPDK
ncbi:hypothetical protein HRbin36_01610 [bacterium HR36]|nr:hypothetical protein HRbin36_01610 [bacterium HR36]